MPEEEFKTDILNNTDKKPENGNQVDVFPNTENLLNNKRLATKKETIQSVLSDPKLKTILETILSSKDSNACTRALIECQDNETEIKEIILANLPEGYAYNVSTNEVVKTDIKKSEDYTGAITMDQKTDEADQKTDEADQKTEKTNVLNEEVPGLVELNIAIEERGRLIGKYPSLASETNENSDNYKNIKSQLEEKGVLNKLKESGHDDNFINDYILVQTTLKELKSNPTTYEQSDISFFDKVVKNLDNACKIPDTSLSSFSTENIAQTRTELFNEDIGNDSLIQARQSNIESHKEVYDGMFPMEIGEDDLITKYGNLLQGELKQFFENYVNNTGGLKDKIEEIKKNDNPTEEDKKLLEFYNYMIAELDKKRKETDEQTKQLMEEMCIISQIRGIYMCIGQEEGKDFTLNKAREITNKNGVLTLEGHIDGVDFSVSHDTINPNQHLKIKSKLGVDPDDKNTFEIGKENNYVNSPFILPNQEEIFRVITKVVQSNDTSKSDDLPKYLDSLQNNIIGTMDKVYKDAEFAHHYITNKVKGEKIIDGSLSLIKSIKPDIDLTKPINQTNNPKLYSFLRIINFNLENSTTEEKNKLNDIISKIGDIIRDYRNGTYDKNFKYPEIIENYLINDDWKGGDEEKKLGLISDLFSYYNNCSEKFKDTREGYENGVVSRIIINDLYRDLFNSSNEKSLVSEQWEEERNKKNADSYLAAQLSNPEDFPPSPDAPSMA